MADQYSPGSMYAYNADKLARDMQSTDPDVLVRVTREHATRSRKTAGLCAGFAGRCAAKNSRERKDCPFTDPDDADLAEKWLFWFDATIAGMLAERNKNTDDLLEGFKT